MRYKGKFSYNNQQGPTETQARGRGRPLWYKRKPIHLSRKKNGTANSPGNDSLWLFGLPKKSIKLPNLKMQMFYNGRIRLWKEVDCVKFSTHRVMTPSLIGCDRSCWETSAKPLLPLGGAAGTAGHLYSELHESDKETTVFFKFLKWCTWDPSDPESMITLGQ